MFSFKLAPKGENAMLASAKVGSVYNFDYIQPSSGETRRHLARVVCVRKLTDVDIRKLDSSSNYRQGDAEFKRTETIVTCKMPDGKFRNFYAERTENCRRSILGAFLFYTGLARLAARR